MHVFPRAAAARQHDPDTGRGDVDTFVEDLTGDDDPIVARVELLQDVLSFLDFGLMRNRGNEITACDFVDGRVVGREDDDALAGMLVEKPFENREFGRRATLYAFELPIGLER